MAENTVNGPRRLVPWSTSGLLEQGVLKLIESIPAGRGCVPLGDFQRIYIFLLPLRPVGGKTKQKTIRVQ